MAGAWLTLAERKYIIQINPAGTRLVSFYVMHPGAFLKKKPHVVTSAVTNEEEPVSKSTLTLKLSLPEIRLVAIVRHP